MDFKVSTAAKAYELFEPLAEKEVEEVWALALGPNLRVLKVDMIFRGTVSSCTIHPREIFRFAILNNAYSLILAHNHPSQELAPSIDDIAMTKKMIAVGKLVEIPLVDHLIITRFGYSSFRENQWCKF